MWIVDAPSLSAVWGPRPESLEACAARLLETVERLSLLHPALGGWHELPTRRKPDQSRPAPTDLDDAMRLLREGRNRDDEGNPIEDMGFGTSLLTGKSRQQVWLNVACGGWSSWVANVVTLTMHEGLADDLLAPGLATGIVRVIAETWQPDSLRLVRRAIWNTQEVPLFATGLGWLTWYSARHGPPPPTLPVARVEPGVAGGWLVTLTETETEATPERAAELTQMLVTAGYLSTPPGLNDIDPWKAHNAKKSSA